MSDRRAGHYNPSDYVPNDYPADEGRGTSRDPYDTGDSYQYRRTTYDSTNDRRDLARETTRDSNRRSMYDDERNVDDDRVGYYRGGDNASRSRSRRRTDRDDRRSRSRGARRDDRDDYYYDEERDGEKLKGHFGKEKKDLYATVIGAAVGGFLGHEAGGKKGHAATIGGAVLGGLAANAWEHQHLKKQQEKKLERAYSNERYEEDDYYDRR